ncbi:rhamnan synthesis F family protein [Microbulbifer agarilyticus]|uniref:rhamnan synthesis F family protein n=1 Tax=Microbulbifer agarilyticus TaxID=260552 RepID=UPI001CD71676|nr:rhamnan synthesis F family protein [Microbulbifer agarilyticus]MCA0893703.1 rhamnan synthesis F family protein [Microbulbifer agarilyticus]
MNDAVCEPANLPLIDSYKTQSSRKARESKKHRGLIERIEGAFLYGWNYTGEQFPNTASIIVRTKNGDIEIECNHYRKDLDQLNMNNGYCGFKVPTSILDQNTEIRCKETGELLIRYRKYSEQREGDEFAVRDYLTKTIRHAQINKKPKTDKAAIISSFIGDPSQYSYHKQLIKYLQGHGYYTILVIPTDKSLQHSYNHQPAFFEDADATVIRENFGYDFGSYATGLCYSEEISEFKKIIFCNDSIIGPLKPNRRRKTLTFPESDFWCITESFEHEHHAQSYFFGVNYSGQVKQAIREFFFGRGMIYTNDKKLVIKNFELAMTSFLRRKSIGLNCMFPMQKLLSLHKKNRTSIRKEHWERTENYFAIVKDKANFNITHFLWKELFQAGFPFIKKELIKFNPTRYPHLNEAIHDITNDPDLAEWYRHIF